MKPPRRCVPWLCVLCAISTFVVGNGGVSGEPKTAKATTKLNGGRIRVSIDSKFAKNVESIDVGIGSLNLTTFLYPSHSDAFEIRTGEIVDNVVILDISVRRALVFKVNGVKVKPWVADRRKLSVAKEKSSQMRLDENRIHVDAEYIE